MLEKTRLPDAQNQLVHSVSGGMGVRRIVVNSNWTQASTEVQGKGEQQVSVNKPLPAAENKKDAEPLRDNASQGSSCSEGIPSFDPEQIVKNMIIMRQRLEEYKQRSDCQETPSTMPSPAKTPGPLGRISLEGILERSALLARQRTQAKSAGDFVAAVERITDVADKLSNEKEGK